MSINCNKWKLFYIVVRFFILQAFSVLLKIKRSIVKKNKTDHFNNIHL